MATTLPELNCISNGNCGPVVTDDVGDQEEPEEDDNEGDNDAMVQLMDSVDPSSVSLGVVHDSPPSSSSKSNSIPEPDSSDESTTPDP